MGVSLFGREREIDDALHALAQDGIRGVLLAGVAGCGKSHLASALLDLAASAGLPTLRVYGGAVVGDIPLGALAADLPPDIGDTGTGPALALKRSLAEQSRETIVLLDDGDLLDDGSARAVVQAAEAGMARLMVTQRVGTLLPDALARLVRSGALVRIDVPRLDVTATIALAERVAGDRLDPEAATTVANLTEGNPLFVRELILAARDNNAIHRSPSGLRIDPIPADASRLHDLLTHRVADLSAEARAALTRVAAAEPLGPGELLPFVDSGILTQLDECGLLAMTLEGRRVRIRMAHPLHAEILRAAQSPLALRTARGEIASEIARLGARRREDRLRLATWALDGGTPVEGEVLVDAARTALVAGDFELAERLARAGFDSEPTFTSGWVLESALFELGDPDLLDEHWKRWLPLAHTDAERATTATSRASSLLWRRGSDAGIDIAIQLSAELEPSAARDELDATVSSLYVVIGDINRALAMAEPLLERPPSRALVYAALSAGHGLRASGHPLRAVEVVDRAIDAYRTLGPAPMVVSDLVLGSARSLALADAGRLDDGADAARESITLGRDAGARAAVGLAQLVIGWTELLRGRLDLSINSAEESDRSLELAAHWGMRRWALALLALAHGLGGDRSGAAAAMERLDALGPHPAGIFEGTVYRARAWLASSSDFPQTALDHLRAGATHSRDSGNVIAELACWHDIARLGHAGEAACAVEALGSDAVEGDLLPAQLAHIAALAVGEPEDLVACMDRFVELGTMQWAAEAAEAAAVASSRRGDGRMVPVLLARAAELRATMGEAPNGVRAAVQMPLTRREREVAVLAAQGVSSRDIGDRLYVSARTIESHLARIYHKLGIHGRAELAQTIHTSGRSSEPNP